MPKKTFSRAEVELLQFNGRWQLASQTPCPSCSTSTVKPSQYKINRIIGKGSFGRVYHVTEKQTEKPFAMKVIEKNNTKGKSSVVYCVQERRLLSSIDFPFIVKYETHLQTRSSLLLIMEYVEGTDLFRLLRANKRFTENQVRFYVSQVLLSLEYLHQMKIIFRDIKLENILIDRTGNVKMVDLGLARVLTKSEPCRSFCGTIHYLAPEIIAGKEYNEAVDWWSLGVLAYELRFGNPPFISDEENNELLTTDISEKILNYKDDVEQLCPDFFEPELVDLLVGLLCVSPESRLRFGATVRDHAFFSKVNFDDVYFKSVTAPIIPNLERRPDCSSENINSEVDMSPSWNENDIYKDF